jgi:large subunit ribosomal protein L9
MLVSRGAAPNSGTRIEDNMSKKNLVELLLLENVDNLGIVGDVVQVKTGYARNYLVPMGLATVPTEEAKKAVEARRAEVERQLAEKRQVQEQTIARLEGHEITLLRAANEQGVLFGSVTQHDIAEHLREEGFAINERDVRIGEPLKRLDSYMIPIKLADDLAVEIKVWVVSDKPLEELEAEGEGEGPAEGEGDSQGEPAEPQTPIPTDFE